MYTSEYTLDSNRKKSFFYYSYLFGTFLLVGSIPFSKFLISVSEIILFVSWLLEGDLKRKITLFLSNNTALIISSLFILHLIGLLYTSDFQYGLEDVRKKIPLLLFPLLFSSSPLLSKKIFNKILLVFISSVVIATVICFYVLLGYSNKEIINPQQASIFISHIRFGLLISLSIFIIGYFGFSQKHILIKFLAIIFITWLIAFLIMMESATGFICTLVGSILLLARCILRIKDIIKKIVLLIALSILTLFCGRYLCITANRFDHVTDLDKAPILRFTQNGNVYMHDTLNREIENGHYVWRNVCEKELKKEWNKKSSFDYEGRDLRGNGIKYTLIRFLTSKGLNKDSAAVASLSKRETEAIEKGIPDVNFMPLFNPTARLQKIIWEFDIYKKGRNPSGHSVVQRFEFWKAAIGIIKENPIVGVGTGDVKNAFSVEYDKINSPLTKKWRLRSHNQFLAIGTAFGWVGIILFLITLFYPLFIKRNFSNFFYLMFFCIAFMSMFGEDTLESQLGATFFAFFNSFFLFCQPKGQVTV